MHNLLDDDLIAIRTPAGSGTVSLPELFVRLAKGEVDGYSCLRPHQADPWHVFLVSLAASIQARSPTTDLSVDRAYWRAGLMDLADGEESAWHLVVDDVSKPALLQHPLAGEDIGTFKLKARTPDELDVLVTAKDHDIKMARAQGSSVQTWLFALVTYQTTSGFLGAGNYGTLRMNGGFGSRPVVALITDPHISRRFIEEVHCLADMRSSVVKRHGYRSHGVALSWLTSWDRGSQQLQMSDLEPWFIEAVRAVRLKAYGEQITAFSSTSKARQVGPKSVENGDVGDPWTPINVEDKKKGRSALTVSDAGWHPRLLTSLLFQQGFELTALQTPRSGHGTLWFVGSTLVRGQGTTEGFHRFALPIPASVRPRLLKRDSANHLGKIAQALLADVSTTEHALGLALMSLAEGGPETVNVKNDTVNRWIKSMRPDLMRGWEDRYFPTLWEGANADDAAQVIAAWRGDLVRRAQDALRQAEQRLPLPSTRRYKALVCAERVLNGSLFKAGLLTAQKTHEDAA